MDELGNERKDTSIIKGFREDYHSNYLRLDKCYTFQKIEKEFGVKLSKFGNGINYSPSSIILISKIKENANEYVYHDHWTVEGDYIYSGEGKIGDQVLNRGNAEIVNAASKGKKIYLFVKLCSNVYYYQGIFQLLNYTTEQDKDELGDYRREFKFHLQRVGE